MGAEDAIPVGEWSHPDLLSRVEDRIDSALSSSNSILNLGLGVVRTFVHAVLHVVFAFTDLTIGWVYQVVHWVFDWLQSVARGARNAITALWHDVTDLFATAVGRAGDLAGTVAANLRNLIDQVATDLRAFVVRQVNAIADIARGIANDTVNIARTLVNDLAHIAQGWVNDAIHYTSRVADAVRALVASAADATLGTVRRWVDDAIGYASGVRDEVLSFARSIRDGILDTVHGLLDALVRDVVDPVVHRVESFIATEWAWAFDLLKLIESAAGWIAWLGTHAVPEVVATYEWVRDLGELTAKEAHDIGASLSGKVPRG